MAKPEATFISSIHRHLKHVGSIDAISMAGTYTNGIADVYYDGPKSDLWVEYKFVKQLPKKLDLLRLTTSPCLSALQDHFLQRRDTNGHLAWVIVGCTKGGIILRHAAVWTSVIEPFKFKLFSRKELANIILLTVRGKGLDDSPRSNRNSG